MCGIVGAVSAQENVVPFLLDGLTQLEYRGYDSAGVVALDDAGEMRRVRRVGMVKNLRAAVEGEGLSGRTGIGHTRWATHGKVCEGNAHPIVSRGEVSVVHNGIIENYEREKKELIELGYAFETDTDTEVVAHRIHSELCRLGDPFEAMKSACRRFEGAYSLAVLFRSHPGVLGVARVNCPLALGFSDGFCCVASDVTALIARTRRVAYLLDGDVGVIGADGVERLVDAQGRPATRAARTSSLSLASLELGPYSHYMQKEINEQPKAVADTLEAALAGGLSPKLFGPEAERVFQGATGVKILACGTSNYAGMTARHWIERLARIPASAEIASEFRYAPAVPDPSTLVVAVSQSGETLDTLEALKRAQDLGYWRSLAVCNAPESALTRLAASTFLTRAGVERGVASTKAFTTQLAALYLLAATLGKMRGLVDAAQEREILDRLRLLPGDLQKSLSLEPQIREWAGDFARRPNALFLGRGLHYPIALEGALKLKEISYCHAEGYPAGELKHGPLALIDENMPVVVIAPSDDLLDKIKSNMREVAARGGKLYVLTDADGDLGDDAEGYKVIRSARSLGELSPIAHAISVQFLAYHCAVIRGTNVDRPRNLAKAVTVE